MQYPLVYITLLSTIKKEQKYVSIAKDGIQRVVIILYHKQN